MTKRERIYHSNISFLKRFKVRKQPNIRLRKDWEVVIDTTRGLNKENTWYTYQETKLREEFINNIHYSIGIKK